MNTLASMQAVNIPDKIRNSRKGNKNVPTMPATSNKNEVIVKYQLFQRISLAYGFVANISSFPSRIRRK